MKKAKNVFAILAIVIGVIAAVVAITLPYIDGLLVGQFANADIAAHINNLFNSLKDLAKFEWFGDFNNSLIHHIFLGIAGIGGLLFIVLFILMLAKKHAKGLGWWFPMLVVYAIAFATLGAVRLNMGGYEVISYEEMKPVYKFGIPVAAIVSAVLMIVAVIIYISYVCKLAKAAKVAAVEEAPVVAEEATEAVAVEEAPVVAPVAEETPAEPIKEETPAEQPAKVIRRILVHKSGKVVRVLNEHYYDITTNVFVDSGYADPNRPTETEQQHYERLINEAKNVLQPEPVPVAQPAAAPAPIIVVTQPQQPQVVVAQPAPAPAPVAEPTPASAPVVAPAPAKEKVERIPFTSRLKHSDKALKLAYNEIKSEILSYGLKSRVSIAGDTFRLHTKTYIMLVVAGKSLKLYFALDPKDYKDSKFPLGDASKKVLHKDTPLVFKVKSDLSVRRCKTLIADVCAKDGLEKGEFVKHDHVKDL